MLSLTTILHCIAVATIRIQLQQNLRISIVGGYADENQLQLGYIEIALTLTSRCFSLIVYYKLTYNPPKQENCVSYLGKEQQLQRIICNFLVDLPRPTKYFPILFISHYYQVDFRHPVDVHFLKSLSLQKDHCRHLPLTAHPPFETQSILYFPVFSPTKKFRDTNKTNRCSLFLELFQRCVEHL